MHFSRFSAFSVHLILSLLIFSSLVLTMYFFWFPGDLFFLDGGFQGLKLVAMVDLVLGPLLTLIIFKPGKKGLALDMTLIACFQLAALGYGFYATYHQQTIAVVYAERTFNTLSRVAHIESNEELIKREATPTSLDLYGAAHPYTIYTVKPVGKSMGRFMADLLNGWPEAHERSDKYLDLAENYEELKQDRLDQAMLEEDGSWSTVEAALKRHKRSLEQFDLYKFKARYGSGVAVFDPARMRIVDYIKIEEEFEKDTELAQQASEQASEQASAPAPEE